MCWPPAPRRPEDLHADVGLVDLDVGRVEFGPHLHRRETGLTAPLIVEGADPHQAVRAALPRHEAVRVPARQGELGGVDAGLDALRCVVERDVEAASLRPARVHPEQHLREVLGVDAAVLRVDLHDAWRVVVFAGEEAAELKPVERGGDRGDLLLDVALLRLVVLLARQLVQHVGIVELLCETVEDVEIVLDRRVLGVDLASRVGVVPEVGPLHLGLELDDPVAALVDVQVRRGLTQSAALLA